MTRFFIIFALLYLSLAGQIAAEEKIVPCSILSIKKIILDKKEYRQLEQYCAATRQPALPEVKKTWTLSEIMITIYDYLFGVYDTIFFLFIFVPLTAFYLLIRYILKKLHPAINLWNPFDKIESQAGYTKLKKFLSILLLGTAVSALIIIFGIKDYSHFTLLNGFLLTLMINLLMFAAFS